MSDASSSKRPKGRSPAYPSIDLERSIHRAEQQFKKERQYPVPVSVIPGIWGYTALNGPAAQQLSALLKFGLIESEGSRDEREIKVSDLAVKILNHPSSDARREAIRQAALLPGIHQEMWAEYGTDLPSDSNLLWRLTRERGFTETGAKEFIREWRATMAFAQLEAPLAPEDVSAATEDPEEHEPRTESPANAEQTSAFPSRSGVTNDLQEFMRRTDFGGSVARGQRIVESRSMDAVSSAVPADTSTAVQHYPIPIALSGRPPVVLSGPFPLSESEWLQFTAVLHAMKPVLMEAQASDS